MTAPFFIEPFVDTGLGNSAYLIGSHETKKGILIDPLRDVDRYLRAASEHGIQLTHVLDTHLHADFVPATARSHIKQVRSSVQVLRQKLVLTTIS